MRPWFLSLLWCLHAYMHVNFLLKATNLLKQHLLWGKFWILKQHLLWDGGSTLLAQISFLIKKINFYNFEFWTEIYQIPDWKVCFVWDRKREKSPNFGGFRTKSLTLSGGESYISSRNWPVHCYGRFYVRLFFDILYRYQEN